MCKASEPSICILGESRVDTLLPPGAACFLTAGYSDELNCGVILPRRTFALDTPHSLSRGAWIREEFLACIHYHRSLMRTLPNDRCLLHPPHHASRVGRSSQLHRIRIRIQRGSASTSSCNLRIATQRPRYSSSDNREVRLCRCRTPIAVAVSAAVECDNAGALRTVPTATQSRFQPSFASRGHGGGPIDPGRTQPLRDASNKDL